jgi:hypothetical protein
MTRDEILDRYQRYRQACTAIQTAAIRCVSTASLLATAKRLGLSDGKRIVADSDDDLVLVFDLALHTAPRGRRRAIDRYAASHPPSSEEEAAVLAALRDTRFSLFRVIGRHAEAGIRLEDLLRGSEAWLVDDNLEATARPDAVLAMRLASPDTFAISCGVAVPIDEDTLDEIFGIITDRGEDDSLARLADDPRFARSVYQLALELGLTATVRYR